MTARPAVGPPAGRPRVGSLHYGSQVHAIRLEPLGASHLRAIATLADDEAVQRFTRMPVAPSAAELDEWLARYTEGRREGSRAGFAILQGGGGFLGLAVAPRIDREAREAELGYVVVPDARGRGVATEALRLLTAWAFAELGARRTPTR